MKVGDLVRNSGNELYEQIGLFVRWVTFDTNSNPYTCPEILWNTGELGTIQYSLLEIVNESR